MNAVKATAEKAIVEAEKFQATIATSGENFLQNPNNIDLVHNEVQAVDCVNVGNINTVGTRGILVVVSVMMISSI